MKRILILFITILPALEGCALFGFYTRDYITGEKVRNSDAGISLPIGKKKLRSKIHPTIPFIHGLKQYREQVRTFPISLSEFTSYSTDTRKGMKSLTDAGYKNLKIEYWSRDSFRLHWDHPPVYVQKFGTAEFSIDASGVFIFTYKDSSFVTETVFK